MNITERVIREQFPFWERSPVPAAFKPGDATYVVVGCGTSYHLAQSIAASFCRKDLRALAVPGGEWSRRRGAYLPEGGKVHVIGLSRSGTSTETVQALEVSRKAGYATTAVTCVEGSLVTRHADRVVYAETHADEGIVMTASASLLLIEGFRLAGIVIGAEVAKAAEATMIALEARLPAALAGRSHFVCLGAGPLYGIAAEAGIKLQEMSLSHVQAYHPMEYRHGPVSLIDDKSFVALLYSEETREEEAKVASELSAKGAVVVGFGGPGDIKLSVSGRDEVRGLVVLPALQLLGERAAGLRGLDTTAPRHLSKVVVLR